MAKRNSKQQEETPEELVRQLKTKGLEQKLPSGRVIRLKVPDHRALLKEGKMPDILTPLVMRSVYQDLPERDVKGFVERTPTNPEDALKYMDTLDFVAKHTITDETKLEDLLLSEKRWIFRLVMGAAELLITFRHKPEDDVEPVAEVEDVQSTAE